MPELYRGYRIYHYNETQKIVPVAFPFDAILDIRSSKGVGLDFENQEPKTQVMLTHDRSMWLLTPFSVFRKQWEQYLRGDAAPTPERSSPSVTPDNPYGITQN